IRRVAVHTTQDDGLLKEQVRSVWLIDQSNYVDFRHVRTYRNELSLPSISHETLPIAKCIIHHVHFAKQLNAFNQLVRNQPHVCHSITSEHFAASLPSLHILSYRCLII